MPFLLVKKLPRYECLLEAAKQFPDLDPSACEAFLHLLSAGDEAFRVIDAHLAEHNLSHGRFTVMMLLLDKLKNCAQARTPAELADHAHVTRATMTGLIDTLERDGLVKREPDKTDRRQMCVALTPKGMALMQTLLPKHFKRMAALMQGLDENERKALVQLLGKIARQADTLSADSPSPTPVRASA